MPVLRLQVRLPYYTNIPEDVLTNTWHFFSDGVTPFADAVEYLSGRLDTFYSNTYAGSQGAPYINWDAAVVHGYNLADAPPRVPVIVPIPITTPNDTSSNVSPETAICLSFQGVPLSGTPQARRRGRIYLGALGEAVVTDGTTSTFPRPFQAWVDQVLGDVETLLLDTGDAGLEWVVWSPTDSASVPVNNGWIDNSLDTQRRRGFRPTARTTFS